MALLMSLLGDSNGALVICTQDLQEIYLMIN